MLWTKMLASHFDARWAGDKGRQLTLAMSSKGFANQDIRLKKKKHIIQKTTVNLPHTHQEENILKQ